MLPERAPIGVPGIGGAAEPDGGPVLLRLVDEERRDLRRAAEEEEENPRRGGVERPGVPDPNAAHALSDSEDHVVRRDARRLVHDEQTAARAHSSPSSSVAGGTLFSPISRRRVSMRAAFAAVSS